MCLRIRIASLVVAAALLPIASAVLAQEAGDTATQEPPASADKPIPQAAPEAVPGQRERLDTLFERLQRPDLGEWRQVEREIMLEWSKSGSPAMDLLLERGRDAMNAGRMDEAVNHFTALTDHAPEFAEGWNARATAYFSMRRFGLSIADIGRTLALNPRHFGALAGLGMILEELGYEDRALEAFREANALHPHRPDVIAAIARLEILADGTDI
jgi:tetratricopeptide (TPR) repeat protein